MSLSIQWMLVKLGHRVQGSICIFRGFNTNSNYSELHVGLFNTLVMSRCAMYVTVNIICIYFDMHSFDIVYIIKLVWPAKGLRNQLVARGRKKVVHHCLRSTECF